MRHLNDNLFSELEIVGAIWMSYPTISEWKEKETEAPHNSVL